MKKMMMNILFDSAINDIEKQKTLRFVRKEESEFAKMQEDEEFMILQENSSAIIGFRFRNNIVINQVLPIL